MPVSWLRRLAGRRAGMDSRGRKHFKRQPAWVPVLEVLEDRNLLSTFMVDHLADDMAGSGLNGSLRYCITHAANGDTIAFSVTGTINLNAALPDLGSSINIQGPGPGQMNVRRGTGDYAVFTVDTGATVSISGLTISNGDVSGISNSGTLTVSNSTIAGNSRSGFNGGGILNSGSLTINDSTISGNSASGHSGGGVYNTNMLTINNSTISGNSAGYGSAIGNGGVLTVSNSTISGNTSAGASADGYAGGIYDGGPATVSDTTISGNSAGAGGGIFIDTNGVVQVINTTISGNRSSFSDGGGIYNGGGISNPGRLTISNSTISGNSTNNGGGGIFNTNGTVTVSNSTISGNTAGAGGGIYVAGNSGSGHMVARNTIIAANTASNGADVLGNIGSQGYNLIGNDSGGSGFDVTDLRNVNPLLGPLQDNGGPTQTRALLGGSPALNTGDPAQLGTADQRGVVRAGGVNIGAYQASAASLTFTGPANVTAGQPFALTVGAIDLDGQPAVGYAGTVHFTATTGAQRNYTFTAADQGQRTVTNVVVQRAGPITVTGTDMANASITGTTTFTITPAAADHLTLSVPDAITAGVPFAITVTVQDIYGNTVTGYTGTVHFTLTGAAMAMAQYTFKAADMGSHTFSGLVLSEAGDYALAGLDPADPNISGSTLFSVSD
jgi:hypothetical protein